MRFAIRSHLAWSIVRDTAISWVAHNAPRLSASLAFYTILSVSPLLLIATAILKNVFVETGASDQLMVQMQSILGNSGVEVFKTIVQNPAPPSMGAIVSIIGTVTLLIGATGVLTELQSAMNLIWNVQPRTNVDFYGNILHRAASFGIVLAVGSLLIATVISSAVIAAFGVRLLDIVPDLKANLRVANSVLSFALLTILFALTFKFLPDAKIWWRDVWYGAFVTAVLFTIGNYFIGIYLSSAGISTPFGASGSLVVFIVWTYYSSLILFFGVELTQVTATHLGHRIEPSTTTS
ncbi:YihY/virulence factor BrkB family protein [Pirellulaceae bacterium SH449]